MKRKRALDTDSEARLAYRYGAAKSGAMLLDDDAVEHLDPELVAFDDFVVNGDRVAHAKIRDLAPARGLLERLDLRWCRHHPAPSLSPPSRLKRGGGIMHSGARSSMSRLTASVSG